MDAGRLRLRRSAIVSLRHFNQIDLKVMHLLEIFHFNQQLGGLSIHPVSIDTPAQRQRDEGSDDQKRILP
jgi:hypothetical protein